MNIKMIHKNEAATLENADGYLVQYKFKDGYRDFRIGDCMFVKDLATLDSLVKSADDLITFSFNFSIPKSQPNDADKAIEYLKGKGYDVIRRKISDIFFDVYLARGIKVWPMENGKPLPTGIPIYITPDHKHLTLREYEKLLQQVREETQKLLPKSADI
jgi:hypothetical protein